MTGENRHHLDGERMQLYALGLLREPEAAGFEQHLLICHACQDRLAETDIFVRSMQAAARQIRAQEQSRPRTQGAGKP
jgi:anti-sigma factor RsiW